MKPLFVLLISFLIVILFFRITKKVYDIKQAGIIALSLMLFFTGMGHFLFTNGMIQMIPNYIPFRKVIILVTGVIELVLAIFLVTGFRKQSSWLLLMFLITVLPANIYAANKSVNYRTGELDGPGIDYLWFRIPLQLFFMFWVYYFGIKR